MMCRGKIVRLTTFLCENCRRNHSLHGRTEKVIRLDNVNWSPTPAASKVPRVTRAVHHDPRTQYRSNRTEYRTDRTENVRKNAFRFFGIFSVSKRRTELKLWHQTDLELPDVSKNPKIYRIDRIDRSDRAIDRSIGSIDSCRVLGDLVVLLSTDVVNQLITRNLHGT